MAHVYRHFGWTVLCLVLFISCGQETAVELTCYDNAQPDEALFLQPPQENWPETWFHFLGDNVSREGVEADLNAIRSAGIGGVHWFHGNAGARWPGVNHPVIPLSEEWEQMVAHMGRTARDLGLTLTVQTCPGWAMAGGPWIEPEDAMRDLVWSRTDVKAGAAVAAALPLGEPSAEPWRDYQDICVLAFPTPEGDTGEPLSLQDIRSDSESWTALLLGGGAVSEPGAGKHSVRFSLAGDGVIRTLELPSVQSLNHGWCYEPGVTLSLSAILPDGTERIIAEAALPMSSWQDNQPFFLAVNEVSGASEYVFTVENLHPMTLSYVRFYSAARQDDWCAAAGRTLRAKELYQEHPDQRASAFVDPRNILDISDCMDESGVLTWQVPQSPENRDWTILRFGHVNAGYKNGPAPPEATGWECNKLDRRGAQAQFTHYVGRLQNGPLEGRAGRMLMDSWECHNQTWTGEMEARFRERNSYPLRGWLPALTGYVMDSPETTARFLTDWRRTLNDLYISEFFLPMVEQAHEAGMQVQYETAGADVVAMDPIEYHKWADVPMCEFWQPIQDNYVGSLNFKPIKPTASAAHLYGKKRVAAESFTSFALTWDEHWEMLKEVANLNLTEGVTHNVFHTYTHNPQVGFLPPGTSFGGGIGTPFLRGQTWWKYMSHFTKFLSRTSYMLERGRPVVDVLWYLGDEVGHKPDQLSPFPEGYKYDYCNPDILLNRLHVENGRLCTPEGLSYEVLWIPENERMLPETVEKLYSLIRSGAKVVAGPPLSLSTLNADAAAEKRFYKTVGRIWTVAEQVRRLGKGYVAWDVPLESALNLFGLQPQLRAEGGEVLWCERETAGARWFFVTAPVGGEFHGTLDLLASGRAEWWDPVSGEISGLEAEVRGLYQRIRLDLERARNGFIVFRERGEARPVRKDLPAGEPLALNRWTLRFPEGWGAPASLQLQELKAWKDLPLGREGKAFSGTATYETVFDWDGKAPRALLDLGRVDMIADVWVNDLQAGVLWATPYRMDITPWLRLGTNTLRIEVTGTWYNRLVYDAALPEASRKTWTLSGPKAGSPLHDSGLLGPVSIVPMNDAPGEPRHR